MNKKYDLKVYTKDNSYIKTISPEIIMSDIKFTNNLNGGQGQLVINLDLLFDDNTFSGGELITVNVYDENNTSGKQIYYGFISKVSRILDTDTEYIELTCLGIVGLLASIYYTNGTVNQDPALTVADVISVFNTKYGTSLISAGTVTNYGSNISLDFQYKSCLDVLKELQKATEYDFYINRDGELSFKPKPSTATHNFKNQYDLEKLTLDFDVEDIVNKLYLERNGGTIKTYQDLTSQGVYGLKEKKESETDIQNEASQDEFGNNYIIKNANPIEDTRIIINNKYDIENVEPGDTLYIMNINYEIDNLKIEKVSYTPEKISLYVEKLQTLWNTIN